jgi:hypothetical protein
MLSVGDLHNVVKSHYTVGTFVIIGILILFFPVSIAEKVTVYALGQGTNQSGMIQAIQERQRHLLQSRINMVKLLADMVQSRLHEASNLLEITSVDPVVQKTPFATSISKVYMGIPGNLDLQKRKIAQDILSKDKDFGSVYFTMPNGNVYTGEPYSDQKQLPRLNFADRDWYKGVIAFNNTYISSVFNSASIHAPATAIVVPVYSIGAGNVRGSTGSAITPPSAHWQRNYTSPPSGYWVGILDLRSIDEILNKLNFAQNERIRVIDDNGTAIVDSYDNNIQNKNTTTITGIKPIVQMKDFKNILYGNVASRIEIIDGIKVSAMYEPFKVGTHRWGIVLTEPYYQLVRH